MSVPNASSRGGAVQEKLAGEELYTRIRELGRGAFGVVWLAVNRQTGEEVAIKYLKRGRSIDRNVARELKSHISFCHPHVVRFRHLFLTDTHLAIVFEYAEGGDLYHYAATRGALPELEARRLFQQLVLAIEYCHSMGVVNRDIKLENALLDRSKRLLKLTDFGYAKRDQDSLCKSQVGTPNYAAPEVISNAQGHYCGKKADTWSCGVLLYVLLFHKYPFERADDPAGAAGQKEVLQRTLHCQYEIPDSPRVSPECCDMLCNLMVKDPDMRFGTAQIMSHPWFLAGLPQGCDQLSSQQLRKKVSPEEQEMKGQCIDRILAEARELPWDLNSRPTPRT